MLTSFQSCLYIAKAQDMLTCEYQQREANWAEAGARWERRYCALPPGPAESWQRQRQSGQLLCRETWAWPQQGCCGLRGQRGTDHPPPATCSGLPSPRTSTLAIDSGTPSRSTGKAPPEAFRAEDVRRGSLGWRNVVGAVMWTPREAAFRCSEVLRPLAGKVGGLSKQVRVRETLGY